MGEKFPEMRSAGYKIIALADGRFLLRKFFQGGGSNNLGYFANKAAAISGMQIDINPKSWEYDKQGNLIIFTETGVTKDEV